MSNRQDNISIERISVTDAKTINYISNILSEEFPPGKASMKEKYEYLRDRILETSSIGFTFNINNKLAGISYLNVFSYEEIKDQLFLSPISNTPNISFEFNLICLKRFGDILNEFVSFKPKYIVEIAYFYIFPEYRDKGHAKTLWNHSADFIADNFDNFVTISFLRPKDYKSIINREKILDYLLSRERIQQGVSPETYVTVGNYPVKKVDLEKHIGFEFRLSYDRSYPQMIKIARDSNFIPIAFGKALAPIWLRVNT